MLYLRRQNFIQYAPGSIVVEALSCKPEGRGFETRLGELIFSI
jgi:hypothetical protein